MSKGKYHDWITPEGLIKIEGWAKDGLTDKQIAEEKIGITERTFTDWKNRFPGLVEVLKQGKEFADRQVENALFKRAIGYSYEEIIYERLVDGISQRRRHDKLQKLSEKEWEFAKSYFDGKCCYCGADAKLTKDYVTALNNGGEMSFDNIVPCCQKCNSSKLDKNIWEWYKSQPYYNIEREQKIAEYLSLVPRIEKLVDEKNGELVITKKIAKKALPDVTAQIFWLKNRKPEEWRDKQNVELSGLADQQAKFAELLEQRKARRKVAAKK